MKTTKRTLVTVLSVTVAILLATTFCYAATSALTREYFRQSSEDAKRISNNSLIENLVDQGIHEEDISYDSDFFKEVEALGFTPETDISYGAGHIALYLKTYDAMPDDEYGENRVIFYFQHGDNAVYYGYNNFVAYSEFANYPHRLPTALTTEYFLSHEASGLEPWLTVAGKWDIPERTQQIILECIRAATTDPLTDPFDTVIYGGERYSGMTDATTDATRGYQISLGDGRIFVNDVSTGNHFELDFRAKKIFVNTGGWQECPETPEFDKDTGTYSFSQPLSHIMAQYLS